MLETLKVPDIENVYVEDEQKYEMNKTNNEAMKQWTPSFFPAPATTDVDGAGGGHHAPIISSPKP